MDELIDYTDTKQVQNYLLALRELVVELRALKNDGVNAVLDKYSVHPLYAAKEEISHRVNIDFPSNQVEL